MADPSVEQSLALARQYEQSGQLAAAENLLRQVLSRDPHHCEAMHRLAMLVFQNGQTPLAIELLRRAVAVDPTNPAYHGNLGFIYKAAGRLSDTIACFQAAAALRPDLAEAHFNLGAALEENRQWEPAAAAYRQAVARKPHFPEALNNLANALAALGRADESIAAAREALRIRPGFAGAMRTLGSALAQKGQFEQALQTCREAAEIEPHDARGHFQIATLLIELRRPREAIPELRRSLALDPNLVPAMWNLAFAYLLAGELREGFAAYEQRHQMNLDLMHHAFTVPMWDGSELAGRRILLHPEMGNFFGEVIQLARYMPLIAARGGRVILECQPELKTLLSSMAGVEEVVELGQPLPEFETHCPLMSLPSRFESTMQSITWKTPYLSAPAAKVKYWKQKLGPPDGSQRVGLAWAGRSLPAGRSIDPQLLAPLGVVENVRLYSLQKSPTGASPPAELSRTGLQLIDHTAELHDFSDTAALVMNLDLVISIDTAVAHLAGALGRPVWLLLRYAADWRWLLDRADSPWYPTMRIFRQPQRGDWESVIREVRESIMRL